MPSCLTLNNITCGSSCGDPEPTYYHVYIQNNKSVSICGVDDVDEHVVQTKLEYVENSTGSDMAELFDTYFAFDKELFLQLHGWMLLTFVIGFGVGKVINILNISNKVH